ncbi:hypothetical protein QUB56_13875 [Microcoleus sp. AR_TQ3_B6]|uniref:HalD/BesD family halogenase n=1 Tax=Microcoleus sp. AR_TQ3_B6 TaxID=3055284 RepID=UPI002FD4ED44
MKPLINQFILNDEYKQTSQLCELRHQFAKNQYVYLPNLFTPTVFSILRSEVDKLEEFATHKNYQTNGLETARNMKVFGGMKVFEKSPALSILYTHHELRTLLKEITDGPIYHSTNEEIVGVHYLLETGNTHGWHLDDYPFIFIMIFYAPSKSNGGTVECIPNWVSYAQKMGYQENEPIGNYVEKCRKEHLVQEYYHAPGDAYLMRADQVLHRVSPLKKENEKRAIVGFDYSYTLEVVNTDRVTGLYD